MTFLKTPVTANVIEIKDKKIVVIDRGKESGLRVGMRLFKKNTEPSIWSDSEIISVQKNTAELMLKRELKVGDILTSKFVRSKEDQEYQMLVREMEKQERQKQ